MSGPKVSIYELTPAQRAILMEELRQQQLERIRKRELLSLKETYKSALLKIEQHLPDYQFMLTESKNRLADNTLATHIDIISKQVATVMQFLENIKMETANAAIDLQLAEVQRQLQDLDKRMLEVDELASTLKKQLEKQLSSEIGALFSEEEKKEVAVNILYQEKLTKTVNILKGLEQPYLPAVYKREIASVLERLQQMQSYDQLEGFCTIELNVLVRKCKQFTALWQRIGTQYQQLTLKYADLLEQNGHQATAKLFPLGEEALVQLKQLIASEEAVAQERAEQEYIRQTLNEVMEEMGYDVLGQREVTKRSGKHFANELFQYGTDTAVNVTYAEDGQISLELGKLDACDRLPTPAEGNYLQNQMLHFCEKFKELEQRLTAKGVQIGTRIELAPPSSEYAQIINVQDYRLKEQAGTEVSVENKEKRAVPKMRQSDL